MSKKLTQEQVIDQFREVHGNKYIYDKVKYKSTQKKVWIGCKVEGHGYFEQRVSHHKNGIGCPICGGSKKLTQEQVVLNFIETHGNKYLYDKVEYINSETNVLIGCKVEGHGYFEQRPTHHKDGGGCPKCAGKISKEEAIQQFIDKHGDKYVYDMVDYKGVDVNVLIGCKIENHGYFVQTPYNHRNGRGCPECAKISISNALTYESDYVIGQFKNVHGDKYLYDKVEYMGNTSKVLIGCKVDGHGYFEQTPSSHKIGTGCPICAGNILHDGNRLSLVRPDLIKYFVNLEDADNYTVSSSKLVQLKCPDCGKQKTKLTTPNRLSNIGFSCEYCSDGISIPEKFGIYLFKQIGIKFETQKIFDWAKDKRYDFYIPAFELLIETHGEGHYFNAFESLGGRSLQEEQENDLLKYDLAIQNGIKSENYIVVDCRYSEFEWLKENYIKQLECYFDLSNVDWLKIWEDCQSSLMPKVWNAWNNKNDEDTTVDIGRLFGLNRVTISRYLKCGNILGLCQYNGREENRKAAMKVGKLNSIKVNQYTLESELIKTFNSITEASKELNICNSSISQCCREKESVLEVLSGNILTEVSFNWGIYQ